MRKDLKIGILIGLILAASAAIWLATRPSLSTEARLLQADSAQSAQVQKRLSFPEKRPPAAPSADVQPKNIAMAPSAPTQARPSQSSPEPAVKIHVVERGQTLSDIAYKYYGSPNKWQKIFEANRSRLKDANTLIPGMRLTIPD